MLETTQSGSFPPSDDEPGETTVADLGAVALEMVSTPVCFLTLDRLLVQSMNRAAWEFFRPDASQPGPVSFYQLLAAADRGAMKSIQRQLQQPDTLSTPLLQILGADTSEVARFSFSRVGNTVVAVEQASSAGGRQHGVDPLTGLRDRFAIQQRIQTALADREPSWGVLFIDLNDYKFVNDRCGHLVGDRVLVDFAGKLRRCSRQGDLVCRYGGDEFVMFVDGVNSARALRSLAARIAEEAIVQVTHQRTQISVSASVGCAFPTPQLTTYEQVIQHADRDMYLSKRRLPR